MDPNELEHPGDPDTLNKYHDQMEMVEDAIECANECVDGLAFLAFKHLNSADSNEVHLAQALLDACELAKIKGESVELILSAFSSLESYLTSMPGVATAAGSNKTVKWSGAVKLVQEDPGNVYSVFLDDVFVCTLKENSPSMSALATELDLDLAADEQEIVRKWAGPLEFKQVGDTPLFDLYLGKIFLCKLTSNSPQGKDLEEMLLINLVELVDPKFKRSDDDWRVYPTEKEKAEREAKKAAKTKQAASLKATAGGVPFYQKVLPVLEGTPYRMYSNDSGSMANNGIAEMLIVKKDFVNSDNVKAFRLNFNKDGTFKVDNLGLMPPPDLLKKVLDATLLAARGKMTSEAGAMTAISLRVTLGDIRNFKDLPANVKEAIKSADYIESRGFQELLGYSEDNTIIWSAGGYWDDREFIAKNFGSRAKDKIQWAGARVAKAAIKNPGNQKALDDIDGLSDGTFASLTNIKNGMQISKLQTAFGNFVYSLDKDAGTWQNAWSLWMKKLGVTEHKRGMVDGKELWSALFGEDIRGSIKNAVSSFVPKAGNIAEPKLEKFAIVDCYGDPVSDYLFDSEKEAEEVLEDAIEANDEEWEDYAIEKVTSGFVAESNKRIEKLKKLYPKAYGFAVPLQKYNKELDKMFTSQEMVISSAKPTLKEIVKDLISNERFQSSLPSLVDAAKLASQVALSKGKDDAFLFNNLCIDFLVALKDKKLSPSLAAAEKLVAAGHGEAFGL